MGGVYGPVNSTGMPCFLGLLLARECGLTNPDTIALLDARSSAPAASSPTTPAGGRSPTASMKPSTRATRTTARADSPPLCFRAAGQPRRGGAILRQDGHRRHHRAGDRPHRRFLQLPLGAARRGCRWRGGRRLPLQPDPLDARPQPPLGRRLRLRLPQRRGPEQRIAIQRFPDEHRRPAHLRAAAAPTAPHRPRPRPGALAEPPPMSPRPSSRTATTRPSRSTNELVTDLGNWSPKVQRRAAERTRHPHHRHRPARPDHRSRQRSRPAARASAPASRSARSATAAPPTPAPPPWPDC